MTRISCLIFLLFLLVGYAWAEDDADAPLLPPPPSLQGLDARFVPPGGGLLGFDHGQAGSTARLSSLAHIHGIRINHMIGHGLVVGLQGTGDSQQTLLSIQFLLNTLRHESITLPLSLNPANMQVRNLAAVMVTADLPPFVRVGARIDVLVSTMGDAHSLQGGTLLMTPLRGADGEVYALAQGPLTVEGYFANAGSGSSERKNFQTAGQIPGGATVERDLHTEFANQRKLELDFDNPDPGVAMRTAAASPIGSLRPKPPCWIPERWKLLCLHGCRRSPLPPRWTKFRSAPLNRIVS